MKPNLLLLLIGFFAACQSKPPEKHLLDTLSRQPASHAIPAKQETNKGKAGPNENLIYDDGSFATYSDPKKRGPGVISFDLDINDRLMIYDEDDALFGEIVLNEDQTYFTMNMPRKIVARKVVPTFDFAAFDFDAEPVKSDDAYLRIYVNGQLRKVKKDGVKYTFRTSAEYEKMVKKSIEIQ